MSSRNHTGQDLDNHLSRNWKNTGQTAIQIANQIKSTLGWDVQINSSVWVPVNAKKDTVFLYVNAPEFAGTKTYYVIEVDGAFPVITFVSHDEKGWRGNFRFRDHENEKALEYYVNELLYDNSAERRVAEFKAVRAGYSKNY